MIGAKITGSFNITDYEIRGRERHDIIKGLLFEVFDLFS
jgi:hypothetical protein